MHILATSSASLDDLIEPVDLGQEPADIVALSFADSDLAALSSAWHRQRETLPSLRLAPLRELRHPMSVDLWIESVAAHAKIIVVRLLGGYDWWSYGCDRLSEIAIKRGIKLALLPGECRETDERLTERSTLSPEELGDLLDYFRQGGPGNIEALLGRLAAAIGHSKHSEPAKPIAKCGYFQSGTGVTDTLQSIRNDKSGNPVVMVLFYRSMLLAGDIAPIEALCHALSEQDFVPVPVFVSSLKDPEVAGFVEQTAQELDAKAIVATTAFAAGQAADTEPLFDRIDRPVFQAVIATTQRQAWIEGERGLAPADLAMHVVLPELDGRILAGAISFKHAPSEPDELGLRLQINQPEAANIEQLAVRLRKYLDLKHTPRNERRIAILLPDYPGAEGRTGYAVGLDVPASVLAMLDDLKQQGYAVENIPAEPRDLIRLLSKPASRLAGNRYRKWFDSIPPGARESVMENWGEPVEGEYGFRAVEFGNITVALAPDRGRSEDRRADYHDPVLPPRHELMAFGCWLQQEAEIDAIIHVGAHGTLEWLPGKAVALTPDCFPEIITGGLPVIYPFIVSNPGEAAQAKRRISAVTLGHLPPPLTSAGSNPGHEDLERLVDEYAQADGLDSRRRDRLAKLIVETAKSTGLAEEAGVSDIRDADTALLEIDAWLCDLKDFAIKDGLHVFGRSDCGETDPQRSQSAECERNALTAALDGKFIRPGPAGAPARGRQDVLPTGRNLFAADPRTMPTQTAFDLGKAASEAVLRRFVQEHGDWPRSLVIDLWGSASLRTGGEEIAQGLALMGCRPQWDRATGRVTGIEVLPPAAIGRPRVDVTWRISGLFRDMFPSQIALMDAAVSAVARRDELEDENPLAAEFHRTGKKPSRIFGSSPGMYGTGVEDMVQSGSWQDRDEIGRAYLEATSHAYGGEDGTGELQPEAFTRQVSNAELLIHTGDDPGRDILEGSAEVAFVGGFSAAVAALGGKADLIALDTTNPDRPRARSLAEAVTRVVKARATNRRFIEGQLRHGPRGASEFAETVDRLVGFAETTEAIPADLIGDVHDAYLGDPDIRKFLLRENPAAARSMAKRFADARRRGLWHPLRNSVDADLQELIDQANEAELVS
ncbi:MAG: cobaltochelatase subunit CobN [Rhizobiaceae bacterium]